MSAVEIILDLPIPPSVNRMRRIDWANHRAHKQWQLRTDLFLTAYGPRPAPVRMINGGYELAILVPKFSRLDLDNHVKAIIDYLVDREFVPNDTQKYLRGYSVHWAAIPACHVTIKGVSHETGELVDRRTRGRAESPVG